MNAVLEQVRRKEAGEIDRVVVAGCMVQKYGAELAAEIPEVDHFIGLDELEKAPAAALGLPSLPRFTAKPLATRLYDDLAPRVLTGRRGYAYLKVAEGCNNPCTFCTIPQMRGLQRSRTVESLVREALSLEAQGVSELVLISQDTTRYGEDVGLGREGLATLVSTLLRRDVAALGPLPLRLPEDAARVGPRRSWPRSPGSFPTSTSRSSTSRAGSSPRCAAAAIPRATPACSPGCARRFPGIALRTTFIAGFPSETEADFEELLAFVKEVEFDHLGVFPYSPEPGSGAEGLGDPVPAEVKAERCAAVMEAQREISRRKNRALKGKVHEAILEGVSAESELLLEGRLKRQAPEIDGKLLINDVPDGFVPRPGAVVKVRVTEAHDYDLVGRIVA